MIRLNIAFVVLVLTKQIAGYSGEVPNPIQCAKQCKCFYVEPELLDAIPSIYSLPVLDIQNSALTVSCQRQRLTAIPADISINTTMLYLSQNRITTIYDHSFENVSNVKALALDNNRITTISNNSFIHLNSLEFLDLSNNQLTTIPDGLFCPWQYQLSPFDCPVETYAPRNTTLRLKLLSNPWECSCYMQQFIQYHGCQDTPVCVWFIPISQTDDSIGYCEAPKSLKGVPLNRLSNSIDPISRHLQYVNMCIIRKGGIDFALLIIIFSWIGIMMGYVIHFVIWNNREVSRHKSYIASLEKKKSMEEETKRLKELKEGSVEMSPFMSRRPTLSASEATATKSIKRPLLNPDFAAPSPIWKHRISSYYSNPSTPPMSRSQF